MKTILKLNFIIVFFIVNIVSNFCMAVEFDGQQQPFELLPYLSLLEDKDQELTIKQVSHSKAFVPATKELLSPGFSKSAYWLKLNIESDLSQDILLEVNYALVDHITLFLRDKSGAYKEIESGDALPFHSRKIEYRNIIFNLNLHNSDEGEVYLRFSSQVSSIQMPLRLWTYKGLSHHLEETQLVLGAYYGVMSLMFLMSMLLYSIAKDKLFLLYSGYLFFFQLLQLSVNGLAYQYLWPSSPLLQEYLPTILTGMSVVFIMLFTRDFLETKKYAPRTNKLIQTVISLALFGMLVSLLYSPVVGVLIVVSSGFYCAMIVTFAAVIRIQQGNIPARYFLAALSLFLTGAVVLNLLLFGVISTNFFTLYAMQIGSLGEIILLAVALGVRIIRNEERRGFQITKANEKLTFLNEHLEERVYERTKELEGFNQQLKEMALRDSLTGLFNHGAVLEQLERLRSEAQRHNYFLSVAMLDVDHFKEINDRFGHPLGDKVLKAISDCINDCIRSSDILGRYGGEEFLLVLNQSNRSQSEELYGRILSAIREIQIDDLGKTKITISIGAITYDFSKEFESVPEMVSKADKALYRAKQTGRDKLMYFGSDTVATIVS